MSIRRPPKPIHLGLSRLVAQHRTGQLNRRDFLAMAGAFGMFATAPHQTRAQSSQIKPGGTLRIQQNIFAMKDPRTFDWSELGNMTRGFLEYLVQQNADGTLQGMLLERWETNEDATEYRFYLRRGVTWKNGD